MEVCYNINSTLPKQCQRSRSVLQDGSRTFGLFWKEKTPSYSRRNTVGNMPVMVLYPGTVVSVNKHDWTKYCKTLNICGIKVLQFTKNKILARLNFAIHNIPWLQIVKKI